MKKCSRCKELKMDSEMATDENEEIRDVCKRCLEADRLAIYNLRQWGYFD
ncbi:MAG: hypothetical protein GY847_14515 [Proteobacteria bacterium]|nr:hypothetical protein [Pseudomonadota bacterium]